MTQRHYFFDADSPSNMLYCQLVLGGDQPEAICDFAARHLTELLSDIFNLPRESIVIRIDSILPSRHFIGGKLHGMLLETAPCLLSIHLPSIRLEFLNIQNAQRLITHFLRDTFGSLVPEDRVRIVATPQYD